MRPIAAKQLIAVLKRHGFALARQKGSHCIYRHKEKGIIVPVPLHGKKEPIHIGTLLAIVRQSKIPREEFEN